MLPLTNHSAQPSDTLPSNAVDTFTYPTSSSKTHVSEKHSPAISELAPVPNHAGGPESSATIDLETKPNVAIRFYNICRDILLSSSLNILLVFVPVGIAVQAAGVNPTIVFAMNAIAIIPLAGLLSYATESVASELGDTIGALLNVTFGNAVELIIL